jgi:hypothetical protein
VGQGSVLKGLVVQGVDITIQSPSSIAIYTNFSTGGAAIYNNTIHNNVTQILNRMDLEGQSIKLDNESHATAGNMIHDNTIIGGAQGGIRETNQAGSKLYNNDISLNSRYTNDFCIDAIGVGMEIYDNNCHNTQGRGFHLAGDKISVHDNAINVVEHSNNLEYGGAITSISRSGNIITVNTSNDIYRSAGDTMWISGTAGLDGAYNVATVLSPHSYTINSAGTNLSLGSGGEASSCEIGGAYGIQVESDLMATGTITINNNTVTANAGECGASALRFTSVASSSTVNVHDNVFTANRIGSTTQPAAGFSVDAVDLASTTISNNAFAVDSSLLRAEYDGAKNVTVKNGIVTTASNPASPWLLADFQNYSGGSPAQNLVILDPTYQGTASDQNLHIVQTNVPQELYENWTLSLKLVDQSNAPVSGASVTIKDKTSATVFSGMSDTNGMVQTVLTQQHWLNSGSVTTTPHTVTVTDSKCSAGTGTFSVTVNPSTLATPGTPFVHAMGTCQ